ncbi:MAG: hypothetical protein JRH06_00140 [Deltaproteobacteria bacterium]|nr:hypothetical protein [Deltaproteobacteria bacterium]MBW2135948.1 hypothetical protein [Deltaproteobacteria bacterium]
MAYSGYRANERPLYFILNGSKIVVEAIADRWYGEDHDYFKILGDDGKIYVLRWDRIFDIWHLVKIMERQGRH